MKNLLHKLALSAVALAAALAVALSASCGGNDGGIPVVGVTLSPADLTVDVGSTMTVTANVLPESASDRTVSWGSSNPAVADVTPGEGLTATVRGAAVGEATITVTTAQGGMESSSSVRVISRAVAGVSLDTNVLPIVVGGLDNLSATIAPANALNKAVTWTSSAPSVARVDALGLVAAISGLAPGSATITVTTEDGSRTASCQVLVSQPGIAVAGVALDRDAMTMGAGSMASLHAIILPADATNRSVAWTSSNPAAATVAASGLGASVSALAAGSATITATTADGAFAASCAITVSAVNVPVAGVSLGAASLSLNAGATAPLAAVVSPSNATNQAVTWTTSDASVATVSGTGLSATVTAVSGGTASITVATAEGGRTATCVAIVNVPATGVELFPESLTMMAGRTIDLAAAIVPAGATNQKATWSSSNPAVARVSGAGLVGTVAALATGSATITITTDEGPYTASCAITVAQTSDPTVFIATRYGLFKGTATVGGRDADIGNNLVADVVIDSRGNVHAVGQYGSLAAYWLNGVRTMLPVTLAYSGATGVCVTDDGYVYISGFERTGTANQFIARLWANGVQVPLADVSEAGTPRSRACRVRVRNGDVYVGGGIATANTGTTYQSVIWKNGVRYNFTTGNNFIQDMDFRTDGSLAVLCSASADGYPTGDPDTKTLYNINAALTTKTAVTLTNSSTLYGLRLFVDGDDAYVCTEASVSNAGAGSYRPVYWKVTGNTSTRTVLPVPADNTSVAPNGGYGGGSAMYVHGGSVYVAGYNNIYPSSYNFTGYVGLWKDGAFSHPYSADAYGATSYSLAYPLGMCVGHPATPPVSSVTLDKATLDIFELTTGTLSATVLPMDATQGLTWTSSNPAVATISGAGGTVTINGLAPGRTTITAASSEGPFANCTVNVIKIPVTSVTLNSSALDISLGYTAELVATIAPINATNQALVWTNSNPEAVLMTGAGATRTITALAAGTSTITVSSVDGPSATCLVTARYYPVTSVTLSSASLLIGLDYTRPLTATVLPDNATDKTLTWTSSNPNVAAVSGVGYTRSITGLAEGTATITVASVDGPSATCAITVASLSVTGVSLSESALGIGLHHQRTLVATIAPAMAANQNVTWLSSDPNVAELYPNGLYCAIIGNAIGSAAVTVTTEEGSFVASCQVTVAEAGAPSIYMAGNYGLYIDGDLDPGVEASQYLTKVFIDDHGNIHAAGFYDEEGVDFWEAAYYLNGVPTLLPITHAATEIEAAATDMFVTADGHVYIAGYEYWNNASGSPLSPAARLWVDGVMVPLNSVTETGSLFSVAHTVCVYNGNWYVGGLCQNGNNYRPTIWRGAVGSATNTRFQTTTAAVNGFAVMDMGWTASGTLYALIDNLYTDWDTTRVVTVGTNLTSMTTYNLGGGLEEPVLEHLSVDGNDLYVAGWAWDDYWAHYWKGTTHYVLPLPADSYYAEAQDIYATGGQLHIAGASFLDGNSLEGTDTYGVVLWIDGVVITDGRAIADQYVGGEPFTESIFVK